jgi:hypothetical protein
MTSTRILAGLLAISAGIFSQAAGAQDNAANGVTEAHPGLTTAPAAPAGHPLFHGVKTSISGELSSSPVLTFGWNVDAALFAIGVGFKSPPRPTCSTIPSRSPAVRSLGLSRLSRPETRSPATRNCCQRWRSGMRRSTRPSCSGLRCSCRSRSPKAEKLPSKPRIRVYA